MTGSLPHDESNHTPPQRPPERTPSVPRKSKLGGLAVVALVGIYALAAPQLNNRFGWDLPQFKADAGGNANLAEAPDHGDPFDGDVVAAPDASLLYGLLREVSPQRYISPQGLIYTPGSAEGHRLEHLRRHTKDAPERAGSHGVFDGDMEGALKTIDRAYERAKKGYKTTKQTEDGRTIYNVDMGGPVGFVGGREGKRKRNPMARRVRLILEETRVITAFPI